MLEPTANCHEGTGRTASPFPRKSPAKRDDGMYRAVPPLRFKSPKLISEHLFCMTKSNYSVF